jgi:hypothetical protein
MAYHRSLTSQNMARSGLLSRNLSALGPAVATMGIDLLTHSSTIRESFPSVITATGL